MHKIYKNFLNGESKLIDMFHGYPELHGNLKELFMIISKNHAYLGKPSSTESEKAAAAENAALFTKNYPITSLKYRLPGKCTLWDSLSLP